MPFNIALSGLQASAADLKAIGNDIANAETTGYKESRTEFADVIASSLLGASSTAIGTGVRLSAVTQQFTQGTVTFTDNNLDLAVNGQGFFRLNDSGSITYTRAGAFGLDNQGFIVNSSNQRLTGFIADSDGTVTGAQGDLQVNNANLAPKQTSEVDITLNMDSRKTPPETAWVGSTSVNSNPPSPNSYNDSSSTTVYDSLGNPHIMTTYFMKADAPNTWEARVQIDGIDVDSPLSRPNSTTSNPGILTTASSLSTLDAGELTLNGTAVPAAVAGSDTVSTTDNAGSAISTAVAINAGTGTHGITATVNPTSFNLGLYTPGTLSGTDFQINGQNVVVGTATQAALLTAINGLTGTTGVSAAAGPNNQITLTATDGRNIQLQTAGSVSGTSFTNYTLTGAANNSVQRASVSLNSTAPMAIAGSSPSDVGLLAGTVYAPFKQVFDASGGFNSTLSEAITIDWTPVDANGNPLGALSPQSITVDLGNATQYGSSFAIQALTQDGFTTGKINGVDVDTSGIMFARYTNGQSRALGQVALVNFANAQGLQSQGDTSWSETFSSGSALVGAPGTASLGLIQSGGLEDSNVALTEELVALIVAQRNFQANAQTIQTADAVTQAIIQIR